MHAEKQIPICTPVAFLTSRGSPLHLARKPPIAQYYGLASQVVPMDHPEARPERSLQYVRSVLHRYVCGISGMNSYCSSSGWLRNSEPHPSACSSARSPKHGPRRSAPEQQDRDPKSPESNSMDGQSCISPRGPRELTRKESPDSEAKTPMAGRRVLWGQVCSVTSFQFRNFTSGLAK